MANTKSVGPRLTLKPHWLSERCSSAIVSTNLSSLLFLYRVMMTASRRSCGSFPCSQQQKQNSWSLILSAAPPFFQISDGMPLIPAAFPLFSCSMACSIGVLSNSVFTGCCESDTIWGVYLEGSLRSTV